MTAAEPIPHWPGELVSLGDHPVFLRSAPGAGEPALPRTGHVAQMERPGPVAAEIGMLLRRAADWGAGAEQAREFPIASAG